MDANKAKASRRLRRKHHIRKRAVGSAERPRLTVTRSARNMGVQVIDDFAGRTLAAASTQQKELREQVGGDTGNRKGAAALGTAIAQRVKALGITKLCFDRNGYKYHGRVAALAEAVRKEGIEV